MLAVVEPGGEVEVKGGVPARTNEGGAELDEMVMMG